MKVLLAGESWISESTHYKGFDSFTSTTFHTGADWYISALAKEGITVTQLMAHDVPAKFPYTVEELSQYDVVVLSDIGANSFLLPTETWLQGKKMPNRLRLLVDWVKDGGALMMAGGYLSFQGFEAKGKFFGSPIEEILPVKMFPYDDRVESPEGVSPVVNDQAHPVVAGVKGDWPELLGYNKVELKAGATLVASVGSDPLVAVQEVGKGRTGVWMSDIGPHWCPETFVQWDGFGKIMGNLHRWLAKND